jgi:thiamine transport system substrate-binding protein
MNKRFFALASILLLLAGCSAGQTETETPILTVMTHDSFAVSADLISTFEEANQVRINFVKAGDTGAALNRLILTSQSAQAEADVFYGLDNTFLSRALKADLFEPYQAPALKDIPQEFQLDPSQRVLPVDYGDVCLNYDKAWFDQKALPLPATLEDLTDPQYKGLLVVENPATSSPGLAFMLASIAHFGEADWLTWWQGLKDNQVVIAPDWETAYYTQFSGSSGRGPQPLVVSYASSPAAELYYAESKLSEAPTGSITAEGTCWRQVEFVGILKGTPQRRLAEKFIDFLLSQPFQEDMPLQMFVYPVLPGVSLPSVYSLASQQAAQPASLPPEQIAEKREAWVNAWTELMLH